MILMLHRLLTTRKCPYCRMVTTTVERRRMNTNYAHEWWEEPEGAHG
jgi:glutaredoxin